MTRDEALQVIAPMIAMCGSWDELAIDGWVRELVPLAEVDAAHEATQMVVRNWDGPGAHPTLAYWRSAYQTCARRHQDARTAITAPRSPRMSAAEYLDRLKARAARGDGDAQRQLETLGRIARKSQASKARRRTLGAPAPVGDLLASTLGITQED